MATWLQVFLGITGPLIIIFLIWGLPKIIGDSIDKEAHKKVSKKEEPIQQAKPQQAKPIKEIFYKEDPGDPGDVTL